MEKAKENKGLYIVLSVLLAIALWMYVGKVVNPEREGSVRNLPVTFVGQEVLESRGLMITSGLDQTVILDVKGRQDVMNSLSAETVQITVDVSAIQQPGQYTLAYQVSYNLPSTVSSISPTILQQHPLNVEFTVARLAVRTVPVQGNFTGSVASGYQAGTFTFSPESIEVKGEESIVNQIDYAQVTLSQTELSETYSGELPYTFISFSGEALDGAELETEVPLVRTTLPVTQLKEVPLAVKFIPGGGATEDDITYTITPSSIMVSGAAADLEGLEEISLADIDLSKVLGSDTITRPIDLTAQLTNVSGVTEATVRVTVNGLSTAILEVDNINLINVPAGYTANKETQSRQIQIRGTQEAVAAVTASQIRIVADLGQVVAATGTQTVPVKVYLDGRSDVGVVGEYNIVVSISR